MQTLYFVLCANMQIQRNFGSPTRSQRCVSSLSEFLHFPPKQPRLSTFSVLRGMILIINYGQLPPPTCTLVFPVLVLLGKYLFLKKSAFSGFITGCKIVLTRCFGIYVFLPPSVHPFSSVFMTQCKMSHLLHSLCLTHQSKNILKNTDTDRDTNTDTNNRQRQTDTHRQKQTQINEIKYFSFKVLGEDTQLLQAMIQIVLNGSCRSVKHVYQLLSSHSWNGPLRPKSALVCP